MVCTRSGSGKTAAENTDKTEWEGKANDETDHGNVDPINFDANGEEKLKYKTRDLIKIKTTMDDDENVIDQGYDNFVGDELNEINFVKDELNELIEINSKVSIINIKNEMKPDFNTCNFCKGCAKQFKNLAAHLNKHKERSCRQFYSKEELQSITHKRKLYEKKYYQRNKDVIKKKQKEYYDKSREKRDKYYSMNSERIKLRNKMHYENNKDKIKQRINEDCGNNKYEKRQYYENNKEMIKERVKKYYEKNKKKVIERTMKYYEKSKERKHEYYLNNKEKIKEKEKKYYEINKEKIKKRRSKNRNKISKKSEIDYQCKIIRDKLNIIKEKQKENSEKHDEQIKYEGKSHKLNNTTFDIKIGDDNVDNDCNFKNCMANFWFKTQLDEHIANTH